MRIVSKKLWAKKFEMPMKQDEKKKLGKKGTQGVIEYKPDDDKTAKNNEVDSVSVGVFENGAPMEID